ncbi:MAG: hypothetical protein R3Y63_06820 [Eubacteriales bacterium]
MPQFKFQKQLYQISHVLEIAVGLLATFPIILAILGMVSKIFTINYFEEGMLLEFIQKTIEIIIGIEFVKLIFIHTMDSTIEVLIMAIMRQIIVEHSSAWDTLALVSAICLLFLVRKFLFVRELDKMTFDKTDHTRHEGKHLIKKQEKKDLVEK